ncbi:MAG: DUF4401 domain-containing protein [Sulfuriferula sp.]
MNQDRIEMWEALSQASLVQGPTPETNRLESPWYVKVLLAFSGWLAALFLLGFIAVGFQFIMKNSTVSIITGGMMIGGAFALLRAPKNEFFEHLSLATSLAGQALVIFGIFDIVKGNNDGMTWALISLLQISLAILMPNFTHRVFSAFVAALAFSMALTIMGVPYIVSGIVMLLAAWLWLNEFRYPLHMNKMRAIGYGLVLALILIEGSVVFSTAPIGWRSAYPHHALWVQPWMGDVLSGAVTLYVVWQLLQRWGHVISNRLSIMALLGTLLLCAVSMEARGITVGIVVMILGFAGSNRVLQGLGILSLLFYISSYYYLLDATLLAKAQTLLAVGLILFIARWLLLRMIPASEAVKRV